MESSYFWTVNDIIKDNPISANEQTKWFFFPGTEHSTANIAQTRGKIRAHTHDYHDEFLYILEGEAEFIVGGVTSKVKPGDLIVIPMGTLHKGMVLSDTMIIYSVYAPYFDNDNPDRNYRE
jgi:quercetin dioxygenase-like cupin family protein